MAHHLHEQRNGMHGADKGGPAPDGAVVGLVARPLLGPAGPQGQGAGALAQIVQGLHWGGGGEGAEGKGVGGEERIGKTPRPPSIFSLTSTSFRVSALRIAGEADEDDGEEEEASVFSRMVRMTLCVFDPAVVASDIAAFSVGSVAASAAPLDATLNFCLPFPRLSPPPEVPYLSSWLKLGSVLTPVGFLAKARPAGGMASSSLSLDILSEFV